MMSRTLLLLSLGLAVGAGGCKALRTAQTVIAIDRLEISEITGLEVGVEPVRARVRVVLPDSGPLICLDRVRWGRQGASVAATRAGDCPSDGAQRTQWLDVEASSSVLELAFPTGPRLEGAPGSVTFDGTVGGEPLAISGSRGFSITVGDGTRVSLAPGTFLERVTLRVAGLFPPTASAEVLVKNPTRATLSLVQGQYSLRSGARELVSGPLRVPSTLAPGVTAPIAVDIGPASALGATIGLGGMALGGGQLTLHAEVTVRLHEVQVLILTSRAIAQ